MICCIMLRKRCINITKGDDKNILHKKIDSYQEAKYI